MHTSVRCIGEINRWIKQRSQTLNVHQDVTTSSACLSISALSTLPPTHAPSIEAFISV